MKRRNRNLIKYFLMIVTFFIAIFVIIYFVNADMKKEGIENFPDSYKPYLKLLSEKYQNWKFIPLYTGLDWNQVIKEENIFGKNLVPKNYSDNWKNLDPLKYNVEVDSGWVDSSKQAVEYLMDPRNFLNEIRIFQFEELSYNPSTNNINGIEKILYGTEFYNNNVTYLDSSGVTIYTDEKYSDLILKAGKESWVSPYHLASRIKQEVGPFLSHNSISGNVEGYKGLYNFYNIGATSSSEPMGAIKNGLQYARDGKGASFETRIKYLIPWSNKEKAITGGAIFIGSSYINVGQDTVYSQKFHVYDKKGTSLFWHQYMTNILAPYSEAKSIYNGYKNIQLLDTPISFIIPIYENMPNIPAESPNINPIDYIENNDRVYCNAQNVNIRTGPGTSYEVITTVSNPENMTRIKFGIQSGEKWDRVVLENGIVGYIYQNYLTEIIDDDKIIVFKSPLVEKNFVISGIDYLNNSVSKIKEKIITDYSIEIICKNNLIGTGSKMIIKNCEEVLEEYNFILYGDVNGDGKINSIDLLVLQRYILEIEKLENIYLVAGNINKNGNEPSSLDLLQIQRHILEIQIIRQ